MVGTWTALQDMTEDCGPLNIVPGSHKLPFYDFQSINLEKPKFGSQFENYQEYENFLIQLMKAMNKTDDEKDNLGSKLSNVYNSAVTVLRHHLPMVSYLLGEADGDVALIQLVHTEVENQAIPIFDSFLKDKKLSSLHDGSNKFVRTVEERYTSGEDWEEERSAHETNMDDCGFHNLLGNLGEIDAFVEAMALKLQYTESYNRFLHHAVDEINKARVLRYKQRKEERRRKFISSLERDGREFSSDDERKFEAKEEN
jgi:hypothetical protein